MVESEKYEDAESKINNHSKLNTISNYQESQGRSNNYQKKTITKGNESSIYQDAQSKITSNSGINKNHRNSFSKVTIERNDMGILFYNAENGEKIGSRNNLREEENNEKEDDIYNLENNKEKSEISHPNEDKETKNNLIYEGTSKRGSCCNLPKCFIF